MAEHKRANRRGPYAGGVARRETILDATVNMIAEVGYHGLSMRDVARRVGISHPGVIYHFPSKDALLMAVIERYEEQANFRVDAMHGMEPFAVFQAFLDLAANLGKSRTIVEMECMLAVEASSEVHPAHDHFAERFAGMQQILTEACQKLAEQGMLATVSSPREMALRMLGQWYGLQIQWLYTGDLVPVNTVLTRAMLACLDFKADGVVEALLSSAFASPEVISVIHNATGLTLKDLLDKRLFKLRGDTLARYGLEKVPEAIIDKIVASAVLTVDDLSYAEAHKGFSIDLLGRLVVHGALEPAEYTTLSDLGIVPAEAVAALTAVMAAGAMRAVPSKN